jgi:hypothetical protein
MNLVIIAFSIFSSTPSDSMPAADPAAIRALLEQGAAAESRHDYHAARTAYRMAMDLDPVLVGDLSMQHKLARIEFALRQAPDEERHDPNDALRLDMAWVISAGFDELLSNRSEVNVAKNQDSNVRILGAPYGGRTFGVHVIRLVQLEAGLRFLKRYRARLGLVLMACAGPSPIFYEGCGLSPQFSIDADFFFPELGFSRRKFEALPFLSVGGGGASWTASEPNRGDVARDFAPFFSAAIGMHVRYRWLFGELAFGYRGALHRSQGEFREGIGGSVTYRDPLYSHELGGRLSVGVSFEP